MAVRFATDLEGWHRWQSGRHRLRAVKTSLRPPPAPTLRLAVRSEERPRVLVVLESGSSSSRLSLIEPLRHLEVPAAVLAPFDPSALLPEGWRTSVVEPAALRDMLTDHPQVLFAGDYLPLGRLVRDALDGARLVVAQHGLMTPLAPPLPRGAHLLSWSDEDGRFWASGRTDVAHTALGSQLLFAASRNPAAHVSRFTPPVFLGQLHGAELPRAVMTAIAFDFCRRNGATYRPHPSERDRLSLATHAAWRRLGIEIEDGTAPLAALDRPVVAVYSTGVLEAAARGLPAWVRHPDPPAWLRDFWARYSLSPWGGPPTLPPGAPPVEPSVAVARWLEERS